jgi:hypothetical protein
LPDETVGVGKANASLLDRDGSLAVAGATNPRGFPCAAKRATIAGMSWHSGLVRTKTTPLLTVEEVDKALAKNVNYRAPGR